MVHHAALCRTATGSSARFAAAFACAHLDSAHDARRLGGSPQLSGGREVIAYVARLLHTCPGCETALGLPQARASVLVWLGPWHKTGLRLTYTSLITLWVHFLLPFSAFWFKTFSVLAVILRVMWGLAAYQP